MQRLQAACRELFGIQLRLADYVDERGVLVIVNEVISEDMFRLACVAHELFGMSAVEEVHCSVVYPRPDWEAESLQRCVWHVAEICPDWDAQSILEGGRSMREWRVRQAEFERQVVQRVRAAR